jgi:Cu+-exporting ATPase
MDYKAVLPPSPVRPPAIALCYHCHDACPDDSIRLEEKTFCCEGCKMVYEILNANDLCQYYALDPNAGNSVKNLRDARTYAYLDDPETAAKLTQFSSNDIARVTFLLPQMHCASCIWLLENLYKLDAGIAHSKVNFLKKEVAVAFDPNSTSLRKIAALLASIGYPPEINLGDIENGSAHLKPVSRTLLYQIGLAFFAFGNIMLLSFPEYLGLERGTDGWYFGVFGYLNLVLATPVLLFSARDYLLSAWNGLKNKHLNIDVPLSLGILMLYGRSAFEILSGTGAGYMDSFAGLVFFLLSGKLFQQKTFYHLSFERDYKSYFPVAATRNTPNGEENVPVVKLNPGDTIIVRHSELIPADGILLKGEARVDYSFVTGEADLVPVAAGEKIFAGGKQTGGNIEITLTRRVNQSYLTQLWNDEAFKAKTKSHASLLADRAGRWFTFLILGVGLAALAWWGAQGQWATGINAFTAVMIVACPCAIAISIPFTLGNVLRILGRNRFYLKNNNVIEAFSTINAAVFDKTGTLSNASENAVRYEGVPLTFAEKTALRSLASNSSHPLSRQLSAFLQEIPVEVVSDFEEIAGKGLVGKVNGVAVKLGSREFVSTPTPLPPIGGGGAGGGVEIFFEINGISKGRFIIKNRYRNGLEEVLNYFRQKASVWLLSGDKNSEAAALAPLFPEHDTMRFGQSPQDKLDFVKKLQRFGRRVLMVGDGLNDAGALRQSNVGIVVSENTNNFTPACDAILHADEFQRLPAMLSLAAAGVKIVGWSFMLAACYNIVGLGYAVTGTLSPVVAAILMPLSSVTIILFGTLMSNWKARQLRLSV